MRSPHGCQFVLFGERAEYKLNHPRSLKFQILLLVDRLPDELGGLLGVGNPRMGITGDCVMIKGHGSFLPYPGAAFSPDEYFSLLFGFACFLLQMSHEREERPGLLTPSLSRLKVKSSLLPSLLGSKAFIYVPCCFCSSI